MGESEAVTRLAARCRRAEPQVAALGGVGAPHRELVRFQGVVGVDLGTPTPWAVRATLPRGATDAATTAAVAWCRSRSAGRGWGLQLDATDGVLPLWRDRGLTEVDRLPVFALDAVMGAGLSVPALPGLQVGRPASAAELVAGYGGWMRDLGLARLLVVPDDLVRPERAFLVGRLGGQVVASALVWWADGTGYLSGIGVVDAWRGRGIGAAVTVAAARLAADRPGVDVVWLHASDEGARLYERLGFHRAGEQVVLGDR